MSTLRLQSWATNRGPTRYTVNLDGVPLGCDGLFNDPALVITVGSEVAKHHPTSAGRKVVPHE